jgi:crotonobetainyl-CoA:carnitine CoA-transferase CaiB-like acyl-CoA transferase
VNETLPARSAPELGQDNARLFAELGYDAGRIARLRESGAVQ